MSVEVEFKDNSASVLRELQKATQQVLFAWGTECVAGCVEKASEIDDVTGEDTVDTGRYRAGFGFITPTQGKMATSVRTNVGVITPSERKTTDNFSSQRADKDTVVIANNVEYAPYLEFGTGTRQGGRRARHIMRRGIESRMATMKRDMEQILKGEKAELSVGNVEGGTNKWL